jgi:hypothetical protein
MYTHRFTVLKDVRHYLHYEIVSDRKSDQTYGVPRSLSLVTKRNVFLAMYGIYCTSHT